MTAEYMCGAGYAAEMVCPSSVAGIRQPVAARTRYTGCERQVVAVAGLVLAPTVLATPSYRPVAQQPAWQMLPLVEARTGQSFTLADIAGKTVYVEPMATWCTNCRGQLTLIRDQVRGQDFVISPDGTTSNLNTGFHNADQLLAILTAAGAARP